MNSKVEFWLIRTVVVAYGLACLIAVVCNNTNIDMKANICESCGDTQQKNGMLIWLKELQAEREDMSPYNYEVTEAIPLTAEQLAVGDVNKDGKLDAVDASYVLSYYAYWSTKEKISLEEYLKNNL